MSDQLPRPPGDSMDERERALKQDGYLLGIATVSLVNGMHFSPWFDAFVVPVAALMANFWITSPLILLYLTSLILSVSTLIVAGIPAALFERVRGQNESSPRSLFIWLMSCAVVSLPAILRMFAVV